ncbi:hypothetical protein AAF712_014844 [Marasmius tenuissimus]|uniref:C2H2-type domain-containing protein n=1 Tax=Marasmius tenuissimus TaxID=585030 RepID=A0ABR2ZCF6_9AGAR
MNSNTTIQPPSSQLVNFVPLVQHTLLDSNSNSRLAAGIKLQDPITENHTIPTIQTAGLVFPRSFPFPAGKATSDIDFASLDTPEVWEFLAFLQKMTDDAVNAFDVFVGNRNDAGAGYWQEDGHFVVLSPNPNIDQKHTPDEPSTDDIAMTDAPSAPITLTFQSPQPAFALRELPFAAESPLTPLPNSPEASEMEVIQATGRGFSPEPIDRSLTAPFDFDFDQAPIEPSSGPCRRGPVTIKLFTFPLRKRGHQKMPVEFKLECVPAPCKMGRECPHIFYPSPTSGDWSETEIQLHIERAHRVGPSTQVIACPFSECDWENMGTSRTLSQHVRIQHLAEFER